jgi:hypothetical protein
MTAPAVNGEKFQPVNPLDHVSLNSYGQKTHPPFQGREVYPTEGSCRFPLISTSTDLSLAKIPYGLNPFDIRNIRKRK